MSCFPTVRYFSSSSLYVHWPYCRRRCTYCNFNKYVSKSVDHSRMRKSLVQETQTLISKADVSKISSIFFGGGTPSLARPSTLKAVVEAASIAAYLPKDAEVSMEVNPTAMQANLLRDFKEAGINRVSIGVQTLSSEGLQILGRDHSAEESLRCLETAHALFPGQVSLDLIFGWPGQSLDMWASELLQILPFCGQHLSLYQLTLEAGTSLARQVQSGHIEMPDSTVIEDMYLYAVEFLQGKGFERYEVSNFAKEGQYCQHNMSYWNGGQYIGVGPGAHGRFQPIDSSQREARVQTLYPEAWMTEVERLGHGTRSVTPLSHIDRLQELLVTGLRTKWGISHDIWHSVSPSKSLADLGKSTEMHPYFDKSLVLDSTGLRATEEGINIVDSILVALLGVLQEDQSWHNTDVT